MSVSNEPSMLRLAYNQMIDEGYEPWQIGIMGGGAVVGGAIAGAAIAVLAAIAAPFLLLKTLWHLCAFLFAGACSLVDNYGENEWEKVKVDQKDKLKTFGVMTGMASIAAVPYLGVYILLKIMAGGSGASVGGYPVESERREARRSAWRDNDAVDAAPA